MTEGQAPWAWAPIYLTSTDMILSMTNAIRKITKTY